MSSARPTKVPLAKPLTTAQLHKEQIKEALRGANDEQKQELFQKKKNHIDDYHRILNKIKPCKKPFNQKSNVPLIPKREDLEKLEDEEIDFDQAMRDYIESELTFDDENNCATFFLDDADPDFKRAATGNDEIEEDPDYEYDQEPIEEEVYSAKPLSKPQAIKAFTGIDDKLFGKQFKFITTGYYKAAIAEASRQSSTKHIQLEKSEVIETIKQLKTYDRSITEPGEGLLFAEQDPSLTFFISVYLKNPYLHNISSPVDVPLLKPIFNFSKEQLPFSSLQLLLIVQDDQYEQYTNTLKESDYIGKLKVMKLSDVMLDIGTTYLNGNTFENTRYNRFNEKKHFLNQYDLLFCDATLSKKVSSLFNSYKKRKQGFRPVTVENVVDWVKNDLSHSKTFIVQGNSHFTIRIARTEWEEKDIFANISHFLENKSNNAETKEAFAQLAQSDIRMVMLHTNRSIYVKIYENVDIDMEKAKVFKAENRWKNKDAPVQQVKDAPSTPKKSSKPTESATPKKVESTTPKKVEQTPKKSAPTPKKTEEVAAVEQPTTPKKTETKEEAKSAKKQQTPKKVEEKQEAQPVTPKKTPKKVESTPKKAEPTPKKVESTPKKAAQEVEPVAEPVVQETPKKSQTPKKAATPSATPKRSVDALKAKLGSVQKKK